MVIIPNNWVKKSFNQRINNLHKDSKFDPQIESASTVDIKIKGVSNTKDTK